MRVWARCYMDEEDKERLRGLLTGKTIQTVSFVGGEHDVILSFADGSAVKLSPLGYDPDGIEFDEDLSQ